jgi:hypothetical protein
LHAVLKPCPHPSCPPPHAYRNFFGTVTFAYEVTDSAIPGSVALATVTLTIPSPGGPLAADDTYTCIRNLPCRPTGPGGILGNDGSLAGGILSVDGIVAAPGVGTLSNWTADGGFTFNPPQ